MRVVAEVESKTWAETRSRGTAELAVLLVLQQLSTLPSALGCAHCFASRPVWRLLQRSTAAAALEDASVRRGWAHRSGEEIFSLASTSSGADGMNNVCVCHILPQEESLW